MSNPPDFLIIGAAKSATTSLSYYLSQHEQVFMARRKESHHFLFVEDPGFVGPGDEREFNPLVVARRPAYDAMFAGAAPGQVRGEASVYYLYRPDFVLRALERNPEMKFVAILRHPADRALSAWGHMVRDGREPERDFMAAYALEGTVARRGWSYGFDYRSVGLYGAQLTRLFTLVPSGRVHVAFYEDLRDEPAATMSKIFTFLGLPDAGVRTTLVMNASGRPRIERLNAFLTQRSALKEAIKRVVPYELADRTAQRIRNWNLVPIDHVDRLREEIADDFTEDICVLRAALGHVSTRW